MICLQIGLDSLDGDSYFHTPLRDVVHTLAFHSQQPSRHSLCCLVQCMTDSCHSLICLKSALALLNRSLIPIAVRGASKSTSASAVNLK